MCKRNLNLFNLIYFVFQSLPDRELTVGRDSHWIKCQVNRVLFSLHPLPYCQYIHACYSQLLSILIYFICRIIHCYWE